MWLTIMYLNAQSVLSKINELSATANSLDPDIILITESWSNENISDALLTVPGYELKTDLREDRKDTAQGMGGGLLVYAKTQIQILKVDKEETFNQYSKFLVCDNGKQLTMYLVYRSPNSTAEATENLVKLIKKAEKNVVFIGDFNYPTIDWENGTSRGRQAEEFRGAVEEKLLTQMVDFPTHKKGNILDLVITDIPEKIIEITDEGRLGNSDHITMVIRIEYGKERKKEPDVVKNWKKARWEEMKKEMREVQWKREANGLDTNQFWTSLRGKLDELIEKHVPRKERKQNTRPPWLNREITRSINRKKHLWKAAKQGKRVEEYEEESKRVKKLIQNAKRKLEKRLAEEKENQKPFYAYVRGKTTSRHTIGPLKNEKGQKISKEEEMAAELNKYFSSVFTKTGGDGHPRTTLQEREVEEEMERIQFTEKEVLQKIRKLRPDSAAGPDGIGPKLLQKLAEEIKKPLQILFAKSMAEGIIPDDWRKANITPIFKKGAKTNPGNYRPVALTSVCGKMMERIVKEKIVEHLEKNKLIRESQHGFRNNKSCTTNLLEFMEEITAMVDEGKAVDVIFLDLAKAFDKVPHDKLMAKVKAFKIEEETTNWIENWLKNRKQRVVINGKPSDWEDVGSGVIQGTVLGPTLFTIHIDDLDEAAEAINTIKKFADDTKLGQEINGEDDRKKLQDTLNKMEEWTTCWGMEFNVPKCKVMHIGSKNPKFKYYMSGKELEVTETERDIGVMMSSNLKPGKQCAKAAQTARTVLGQISRAFHYRDRYVFKKLYVQYVRPHLEFAVPAWSPSGAADKEVLEKVQQKAIGMMSGLKGKTYEEKLRELEMETLEKRRENLDMIETYKILNKVDNVDRKKWYTYTSENRLRETRATADSTRLETAKARTELRKTMFGMRTVEKWNGLAPETRQSKTVNQFKRNIKQNRRQAAPANM